MAKDMKLKAALERHKGVDHQLERQKKLRKQAEKRKRQKQQSELDANGMLRPTSTNQIAEQDLAAAQAEQEERLNGEAEGWETDGSEDADDDGSPGEGIHIETDDDLSSDSDSESEAADERGSLLNGGVKINGVGAEDDESEGEEDIPFSDIESLASEEKEDVIPHQRLTINNTAALARSLKSIALPASFPFSIVQSVISAEPVQVADVEDDLNRELAFYKQSLDAVKEARGKLLREGVPFSRPADYFAEMVKTEEQMGKVRAKMVDEAARKRASADARRQRDLKKFGKAVQVAKLQERDRAKRDTMDKISALKRKRQGADLTTNEDDLFDVALENAADAEKRERTAKRSGAAGGPSNRKRQKKDEKFGFGGKKRFAKSNDARSSGDMKGYSVKKMKGGGAKQRPGKSRRARAG